jgi:hypothetical protein
LLYGNSRLSVFTLMIDFHSPAGPKNQTFPINRLVRWRTLTHAAPHGTAEFRKANVSE